MKGKAHRVQGLAVDASKGEAVRRLRLILIRELKGEVAMRLEVWRQQLKMDLHTRQKEMAEYRSISIYIQIYIYIYIYICIHIYV